MFSLDTFLESEERVGGHEPRLEYLREARECLRHRLEKSRRAQVQGCTACAVDRTFLCLCTRPRVGGHAEVVV